MWWSFALNLDDNSTITIHKISATDAGPQFKQHRHKRRMGRRIDNSVGVFRAENISTEWRANLKGTKIIKRQTIQ